MRRAANSTKLTDEVVSLNQRYASYVDHAGNLDTLLWANQTTLLGITVLGSGAIGFILEKRLVFEALSHRQTIAVAMLLTALLYGVALLTKMRLRAWHLRIEGFLADMEPDGYFRARTASKAWYLSAPRWNLLVFGGLAILLAGTAVVLATIPGGTKQMKEISSIDAAQQDGISTFHNVMDNGERRFRLTTAEGNGYILTRSAQGGWQNSHRHARVSETYIVEKGWLALAISDGAGGVSIQRVAKGETVTTPIGQVHNIYLPPNSEIHTVKHGSDNGSQDRIDDTDFDRLTRGLVVDEVTAQPIRTPPASTGSSRL